MTHIILIILFVAVVILLVFVASLVVAHSEFSHFELEKRKQAGDKQAMAISERSAFRNDFLSLQRLLSSLLIIALTIISVLLWGWLAGSVAVVIVAIFYSSLARLPMLHTKAQALYESYESNIIAFFKKYPWLLQIVRAKLPLVPVAELHSKAELEHLVEASKTALTGDEKQLVLNGLKFGDRQVNEIMTPRAVIETIKGSELLGPLVLDELHQTGHSRFPVVGKDIDHIVGMLYIHNILTIDTSKKHTSRVDTAMESRVFYIHEDQTLRYALDAFIKTHHHLFVVINSARETVGLLSLEDVIEALLGRKIVDEFDAHDDLRAVAKRNLQENNQTSGASDV